MNITPYIKKAVIGAILGSILGYAYYHFYGCERGCAITGNPLISTIYGGIMGSLFIASFQKESQKEESK
ncbi:MAG: hypothetical protein ACKOAK_08055 [Ignavibacteria bacterium]|jgi:hypothetical protein